MTPNRASSRKAKRSPELTHEREALSMKIERIWAMPNKWTFTIKPIKDLLAREVSGYWCDPFAGENSPAQTTNDLRTDMPTLEHMDALEFLKKQPANHYDGVLFDPPYSITQAKQCYEGYGMELLNTKPTSMKYWGDCKTEIARIIKPGGKAICFGWTSMGIGKNRSFVMKEILLVPHGGSKNDTIVTIETKAEGVRSESTTVGTNDLKVSYSKEGSV